MSAPKVSPANKFKLAPAQEPKTHAIGIEKDKAYALGIGTISIPTAIKGKAYAVFENGVREVDASDLPIPGLSGNMEQTGAVKVRVVSKPFNKKKGPKWGIFIENPDPGMYKDAVLSVWGEALWEVKKDLDEAENKFKTLLLINPKLGVFNGSLQVNVGLNKASFLVSGVFPDWKKESVSEKTEETPVFNILPE